MYGRKNDFWLIVFGLKTNFTWFLWFTEKMMRVLFHPDVGHGPSLGCDFLDIYCSFKLHFKIILLTNKTHIHNKDSQTHKPLLKYRTTITTTTMYSSHARTYCEEAIFLSINIIKLSRTTTTTAPPPTTTTHRRTEEITCR